jgi:hypothetical protein
MKLSRITKTATVSIVDDPRKEVVRVAVEDGHKIAFPQHSMAALSLLLPELAAALGFEATVMQNAFNKETDTSSLTIKII